ncbi:hypothetical protein [Alkalibacter mobilis]|uniref:hypothetical protein n=1 Tax=Alkalibacter mobilis TaxID=2787712 RepID=UPI00189E9680|nr:hypothetical protein [Alkalibacter mobilis]MBF7097143.1 hypothetical protein [Alkalibacter mobilis]
MKKGALSDDYMHTDPEFSKNLVIAAEAGVEILVYDSLVGIDYINLNKRLAINLKEAAF